MKKAILIIPIILLASIAILFLLFPRSILPDDILSRYHGSHSCPTLTGIYPADGTLFPPELPAPLFKWTEGPARDIAWAVRCDFSDSGAPISTIAYVNSWRPDSAQWEEIKRRSMDAPTRITIVGIRRQWPHSIRCGAAIAVAASRDSAGAPIFYREVNLPFIEAVKDPSKIRWRFGGVASPAPPPVVLTNLPVCGNCHSFSRNGSVLGMDVDYGNDKGAYAIVNTARDIVLDNKTIITWDDFRRDDGEYTFGLLSRVSPDGRYVISTVKDKSVFIPRPDRAYSQLFFPVKGILVVYDRATKRFAPLRGADDRRYVNSNAEWGPDGRELLFIRAAAYQFRSSGMQVLLSSQDCDEFFRNRREFKYDIYRIPFNNGKGGPAVPLTGASQNGKSNYFPRFSPNGRWVVFCQAENYSLLQPDSRLFIMPAQGGTPRLMRCNTRNMNSWHSFSPNGKWLVFSTKVNGPYTQLALTHIDDNGDDAPPVILDRMTVSDHAANIPEFVNAASDAIASIKERFVDDNSLVRMGYVLQSTGDLRKAKEKFQEALAQNPANAQAHMYLGTVLMTEGNLDSAAAYFRKSIDLGPKNALAWYNLGVLYDQENRFDSAMTCYTRALSLDSTHVQSHNNLGVEFMRMKKDDEAMAHFKAALRLNPAFTQAVKNMNMLLAGRTGADLHSR